MYWLIWLRWSAIRISKKKVMGSSLAAAAAAVWLLLHKDAKQRGKTAPCLTYCDVILSPVDLLAYTLLLLLYISTLDLSVNRLFCSHQLSNTDLVYSEHLALFPLLRSCLETTHLLLLNHHKTSQVFFWQYRCWLESWVFLSFGKLSLMYWSSYGVVTFGLPDRAL